jgi:DNA-binding SARP family transcriptional activator
MQFGVLGALEVRDERVLVALGKPQQRSVLAMLVLHANRVVSLERIVDDLWEGDPPARAAGTVHACVSTLRRVLEPDRTARAPANVLVSQAPGYLLRVEPDDIDAVRFERLAADGGALIAADPELAVVTFDAALALWRGPALADFAGATWAAVASTRLEEVRAAVIEDRFDALLAAGRGHDVVADVEAAVAGAPLRERLWGQLMIALYRSGRQADALRTYQRARHVLAEELGIEPGPELQTLERQVLEQSAELDAVRLPPMAPIVTSRAPVADPPTPDRIFGRDDELALLGAAVSDLRVGAGGVIAVTGPAGAGKTRLVEAALGGAASGDVRVAWARCVAGDIAPPLWPWLQLASALGQPGQPLADAIRAERADGAASETARRLMYDAALAALAAICEVPVVLVVDDAQWADGASQHIMQLLVSRLPELGLLLVLTVRDGDQSSAEIAATLAAIARSPAARRVQLGSLGEDAVAEVLAAKFGRPPAPATVALISERAGGNAFYVTELVRLLRPETEDLGTIARVVPDSVRDVVTARVAALSDDARAALAAAAVLGRDFDGRIVQKLASLTSVACLDAFDLATVAGILEPGDGATRRRFCHDLTREAIYEDLPHARRAVLHASAVGALTDLYGDDQLRATEIAAHAWSGREMLDPATVVDCLVRAARAALGGFASERSERLLARAVEVARDIPDRATRAAIELDLSIRLAYLSSVTLGYSHQETARRFGRAIELHAQGDDTSSISPDMLMELSNYLSLQGRIRYAADLADDIVVSAARRDDKLAECAGNIAVGLSAWYLGDMARSAAAVSRSIDLARGLPRSEIVGMFGFPQLGNWLSFLAFVRRVQDDDEGSLSAIAQSRAELERYPDPMSTMWADVFSAWRAILDDDPEAARRRCARFLAIADTTGAGVVRAQAEVVEGWAGARLGTGATGLERIRAGRAGMVAADTNALVLVAVTLEAEVLARLDRAGEALEVVDAALQAQAGLDEGLWLPEVHRQRGELLAAADPAAADRAFARAIELAGEQGAHAFARRAEESRTRLRPG